MTFASRAVGRVGLAVVLSSGALVGIGGAARAATDPAAQAVTRLAEDADRPLTIRGGGAGEVEFVGVPARAELDNPAVSASMSPATAADAAIARYGPALGSTAAGSTFARAATRPTLSGDVVRYQQSVAGVPVFGGEYVVSLGADREVSSMLARTSDAATVPEASVSEDVAAATARDAFVKAAGAGAGVEVRAAGRWVLDPAVVGGDPETGVRTVWRFEVTRNADERRLLMVDDRTGGVLVDSDLIAHVDRVVCDNANVRQLNDDACTFDFARSEGGTASAVGDVNTAFDLGGAVADFYQQVGGIDLTALLGISVAGQKKLASTVRWCYDDPSTGCPYDNAFWSGSQMYYGAGYAAADDVVGHEITHGVTEHYSDLVYWGQSGAMNESISDILGEIIDHRHPSAGDSPTSWTLGEDIPGTPNGLRNLQDPAALGDPDRTSSPSYVQEVADAMYDDNDGVHTNSGVGNKTFYLISQGGSFNGRSSTGIDTDAGLTKSGRLWLLTDQSLSSGSDYADLAAVLDQSCQTLLATPGTGFTAADCANVHTATMATELRQTPTNNPQPADAEATCPPATVKRVLVDSETGDPASTFVAGVTWTRDGLAGIGRIAHSGTSAWGSAEPETAGSSSLVLANAVTLPAGQASYLHFQQWHYLEAAAGAGGSYDAGTVEVDSGSGPTDAAGLPWVNGPAKTVLGGSGNPAAGRQGFGGDSRGYLASRVDLSVLGGSAVRPRFTMNTDDSGSRIGWFLDDISVYTCDPVVVLSNSVPPTIAGGTRVGRRVTAAPGTWSPASGVRFGYQWLRAGTPIAGATAAAYVLAPADARRLLTVRVTASRPGSEPVSATSPSALHVGQGSITAGRPVVKGRARVGQTLKASAGSWRPSGVRLRYRWLRNGRPIVRATLVRYRLVAADKGKRISVQVLGDKPGYAVRAVKSKATAPVKPKPQKKRG